MRKVLAALLIVATGEASAQTLQADPWFGQPCPAGEAGTVPGADSPLPVPTLSISQDYPPSMLRASVEASCLAMFDIDEAGLPANPSIRCNVWERGQPVTNPAAEARYKDTMGWVVHRQLVCTRYAPAGEPSWEGKWRTNIALVIDFNVADGFGAPDQPEAFNRAAPAQAMTSEQAAHYAAQKQESDAAYAAWRADVAEKKAAQAAQKSSTSKLKPN